MATNGTKPRRIVACCDGTWNSTDAGDSATNVVRLARVLKPVADDGTTQLVYYHPGVGTGNRFDRIAGGCTGVGLSRNVRSVYTFIVNNWQPGDEIFLFGFSRGAYTARAVAGLIGRVGLLNKLDMGAFAEAWEWNRDRNREASRPAFEARFGRRRADVEIQCIGVWDTVGAMGIPPNRYLPRNANFCGSEYQFLNVELGARVRHAFQALAINERRLPFKPAVWQRHRDDNGQPLPDTEQQLRQMWFRGVHSDVGGGYRERGAADLAFLWMAAMVDPLLALDRGGIKAERECCEAWGQGSLHDSYTLSWQLVGKPLVREVGTGHDEAVHASVLERPDARHYPTHPVADLTAFEREFRWSACVQPQPPPKAPQRSLCDRLASALGGG